MNPSTNVWTRPSYGAPPSNHGRFGLWLSQRKLITSAYVPNRWQRLGIRGWRPYWMPIPSDQPYFQLLAQQTLEYEAVCPVFFVMFGALAFCNQPEGALVELYDTENDQALINPNGPALRLANAGGDAKNPFFFKRPLPMDAGSAILADITNLSLNTNYGQIALYGYQPLFPGKLGRK